MEFPERPLCAVPPGPARCLRGSDAPQVLTYEFQGGGLGRPRGVRSTTDQTSIQLVTVCSVKGAALVRFKARLESSGGIMGAWCLITDHHLLAFASLYSRSLSLGGSWNQGMCPLSNALLVKAHWEREIGISELYLSFYPRPNISDRFCSHFIRIQIFQIDFHLILYLKWTKWTLLNQLSKEKRDELNTSEWY